jgi:Lar family restriction alleviation protein
MKDDEKLKPCPFCGNEARLTFSGYGVRCTNKQCGAMFHMFPEAKDAILAWNKRETKE